MSKPEKKPHLSPSALNTMCECGERYRRRYIEKERTPPGMAAHKGTGMHAGASANFSQKLTTYQDLPEDQIVDAAVAGFEEALLKEGVLLSVEEEARGLRTVRDEAQQTTILFAKAFAKQQAPDYQPRLVEEFVTVELPDQPYDIVGRIDLVDDQNRIPDFKTGTKKKSLADVSHSVQLTFYAAASHQFETPADTVRLDTLIAYANGRIERQIIESHRNADDYAALSARVSMAISAIEAGIFLPAAPGSWLCSDKYCGYWRTCPYVNASRSSVVELQTSSPPIRKPKAEKPAKSGKLPASSDGPLVTTLEPLHLDGPKEATASAPETIEGEVIKRPRIARKKSVRSVIDEPQTPTPNVSRVKKAARKRR